MRLLACLFALTLAPLQAADLAPQRAQFQSAWRIAQTGADATTRVRHLEGYPLYPYLAYERLRRSPDKVPFKDIEKYLADYGDSLPGHRLRAQVLERYGRTGRHQEFLKLYVEALASLDLRCHAWVAKRAQKVLDDADALALDIYAALDRDRADCQPVLAHLRAARLLTAERVQTRIDEALAAGQTGLATLLSRDLPKAEQVSVQRLILARAEPALALNRAAQWPADASSASAAAIALAQSARKSAMAAEARYQSLARRLPFAPADHARVQAEVARYAAVERLSEASTLLARVPEAAFDDNLREWQVRYALRRLDYAKALVGLDGMSPELRAQSRWRYTRGRVLQLLGRPNDAKADLAAAAMEANFHGFLAADRIGAPYAICPADSLLNTDRTMAVLNLGGIQRALEWFVIGDLDRARAEWFWQLPQLSPELRREAGLIASREGLHEWAIFTLNTDALLRQYDARFPLLHNAAVTKHAKVAGLPQHWVYGLIRAESAWNANARSPVGARGLMQLMPATAAAVAKSLGVRVDPLTDPAHNILLGTTYLGRRVADLDGNAVLATAAYNAGIGAVKRWIGAPLPPWDLWIETVPYKETREYIARVLAFAVLYDWRIDGSPTRVSALIPGMNVKNEAAPIACPAA